MHLVFNELSPYNPQLNFQVVCEIMSKFLSAYSKVNKDYPNQFRIVITPIDMNSLQFSNQENIAKWRNAPTVDRDEKRRWSRICELQLITSPENEDSMFVTFDNIEGKGLQIAFEENYPLISIPSSSVWNKALIKCAMCNLKTETEAQIKIHNVSSEETVVANRDWIGDRIQKEYQKIRTPQDFLNSYLTLFPSLAFHPNAIDQMEKKISSVNIPTIVNKLMILENYFVNWDGGIFDRSVFPDRFVSPESEETLTRFKDEHTFAWNGRKLLVSFHVRYTGGDIPGRIFIYPDSDTKKCIICSLHTKLPTVNYPKA